MKLSRQQNDMLQQAKSNNGETYLADTNAARSTNRYAKLAGCRGWWATCYALERLGLMIQIRDRHGLSEGFKLTEAGEREADRATQNASKAPRMTREQRIAIYKAAQK